MIHFLLILLLAWRIKKGIDFIEWSLDRYEKKSEKYK